MNEKNKRCSMENFNRICLDCGLVPNESKNTMYNNEASYFDLVHPLSEQPIEARKKTKVPLKEFIDFIAPQRELVRNGMVELSVPFNDFIPKLGKNP